MCKPRVPGLDGVLRQPGLGVAPGLIHMELWMCLVWVRVSVCVSVRVCVCVQVTTIWGKVLCKLGN
jgi:hypothetical protein